jgi:hypothetical protein
MSRLYVGVWCHLKVTTACFFSAGIMAHAFVLRQPRWTKKQFCVFWLQFSAYSFLKGQFDQMASWSCTCTGYCLFWSFWHSKFSCVFVIKCANLRIYIHSYLKAETTILEIFWLCNFLRVLILSFLQSFDRRLRKILMLFCVVRMCGQFQVQLRSEKSDFWIDFLKLLE